MLPRAPALTCRLSWMKSLLYPHLPSTPSSSRKRPRDPDSDVLESLQKRVDESGTILKDLSKAQQQPCPSQPELPLPTTLKTACWLCPSPSTRQGPPSTGYCLNWWMRKAMMIFQVPWKLHPSKEPSRPTTLNHLTPRAPFHQLPSAHSAPQHHPSPSIIRNLPTCR